MAIQNVRDLGGLGRLAQTILQNRAIEQAQPLKDLQLRIAEGQLGAQQEARTLAGQQATTGRSLADLVAGITPETGPPIPRDITLQRGAELTAQPGGGGIERLAEFGEQLDIVRPQDVPTDLTKQVPGQKSTPFVVNVGDEQKIATPVFDPTTGGTRIELSDLPEGGTIASRLGETPAEQSARKVREAGAAEAAKLSERLKLAGDIEGSKEAAKLEQRLLKEPAIEAAKTKERGEITALQDTVKRGTLAAESTAILRRGIDLFQSVETGGIDTIRLAVKRIFGIETADEGELAANLGKAVLSQLRETFGAQFTVEEGNRLARIEANIGKNPATNKRLLSQALQIATRTANRAKAAAKKLGDDFSFNDINELLDFRLSFDGQTQPRVTGEGGIPNLAEQAGAAQLPTIRTQEQFDALDSGAVFIEDGVEMRKP